MVCFNDPICMCDHLCGKYELWLMLCVCDFRSTSEEIYKQKNVVEQKSRNILFMYSLKNDQEKEDSLNSREILKAVTLIDNEKQFFMEMNEEKRDKKE